MVERDQKPVVGVVVELAAFRPTPDDPVELSDILAPLRELVANLETIIETIKPNDNEN